MGGLETESIETRKDVDDIVDDLGNAEHQQLTAGEPQLISFVHVE